MERLKSMLGAYNGHLKQIEQRLNVQISHRGEEFFVDGDLEAVERAESLLQRLHSEAEISQQISSATNCNILIAAPHNTLANIFYIFTCYCHYYIIWSSLF